MGPQLTHKSLDLESNSPGVREVIRSRRTVHNFLPDPPPASLVRDAIDSARWAPNHRLTQPWRFYVVGPSTAASISEVNANLVAAERGAYAGAQKLQRWLSMPGWLVVTCRRSDDNQRFMEDYAATACAVQNLLLDLWEQGIASKWGTGRVTRHPEFFELLGADQDLETVVGMIWYGYPAEKPDAERLPVEAIMVTLP